jgi:hypothetical protein
MPRGDRTGPFETGPRTGRAAGYCAGFGAPGYANPGAGPGYGRGPFCGRRPGFFRGQAFGRGRGFRQQRGWGYPAYGLPYGPAPYCRPGAESEKDLLQNEVRLLKEQLSFLEKRIKELDGEEKNEG